MRSSLRQVSPRTKIAPTRATEYDTVRTLVRARTGLLPTMIRSVEDELAAGCLVELDLCGSPMMMEVRRALAPWRPPSPATQALVSDR